MMFGLSSCMDTFYVTNKATFDNEIRLIEAKMAERGLSSTGKKTNTRNEAVVSAVSYSRYSGYGTAMENNFITEDTYTFADSLGNTMNYSVSYEAKQTRDGVVYVENIDLCGCEVSNPKEYDKLCGVESPIRRINDMPRDQQIQMVNTTNTTLTIMGVSIAISLLVMLMFLK